MNAKKEKYLEAIWYLAVFAFFYIWFSRVHPLIVYDADDWTYIAYVRKATPIWGEWNPAKVFPEVLMPFFSSMILHTITPLVGDYITGFTVGHALVVSGFITAYVWCLVRTVRRSFSLSRLTGVLTGTLFLIFHFLIFRTEDSGNSYLFRCVDLNCYYNYLLPALLNACLMMYMMDRQHFDAFLAKASAASLGIFYVVVYFAVFSNLVTSGILAAYAGSCLLLNLLRVRKQFKLNQYIRENTPWLVILIMWFVSAIFELSGGRAAHAGSHSMIALLHEAAYCLKDVLFNCNPVFWICVFVITVLAVLQYLLTREKAQDEAAVLQHFVVILVAGAALTFYMLALCAMVWTGNVYRSEYQFPLFFYGFLLVFLGLGYLLKKQPKLTVIMPLLLVFLASCINTSGKTFLDSHMTDVSASTCADISRDIINQYLEADAAGLETATIYVPMHVTDPETEDNWPHSAYLLPRVGGALYEQGITSRHIYATIVADPSVNERFNIPLPTEPEK